MAFEGLRERFEGLAPRERRLLMLLGATLVVCVFGVGVFRVSDGLGAIADKIGDTRTALRMLEQSGGQFLAQRNQPGDGAAAIGDEAPRLATYLESVANEVGIQIPETTERPIVAKGKFHQRSVEVKLRNVTVQQLADFLRKVETKSPIVVSERVYVRRSTFGSDDKLDAVELTIDTYERAKKDKPDAKGDAGAGKALGAEGRGG